MVFCFFLQLNGLVDAGLKDMISQYKNASAEYRSGLDKIQEDVSDPHRHNKHKSDLCECVWSPPKALLLSYIVFKVLVHSDYPNVLSHTSRKKKPWMVTPRFSQELCTSQASVFV